MIKIEFSDLSDSTQLNAADLASYVGVEFKSKNEELRVYVAHLTVVFFIANFINLVFYSYKLNQVPFNELGQIKLLVLGGLVMV